MAEKSDPNSKLIAENRRARFDYHIESDLEAGIMLYGSEVKSLRKGGSNIAESYASVEGGELWLINSYLPEYLQANRFNHEPRRRRKLLLNASEIYKLAGKIKESGYTLIPLSLYFKDGRAKVEIALARGKKEYDKRQTLREQQDKREADRAMSSKGKDW